MARSLNPSEMEEAIEVFEQVVKSGGPLSLKARLAQASLLNALKRPKEALGVLDKILDSKPDPNLRYAVIVEKGDTLFAQGTQDSENYKNAIAAWRQISSDPECAKDLEPSGLGKNGRRLREARQYRCRARLLLWRVLRRSERRARSSFGFTEPGSTPDASSNHNGFGRRPSPYMRRSASVDGPRAEEARERVNRLRLENFIWDS